MSEYKSDMPDRVLMAWAPVFDARGELQRLVGILGAVIYLSAPDADEPEKEDLITALVTVQETIAECADGLHEAITGMKIPKEATA